MIIISGDVIKNAIVKELMRISPDTIVYKESVTEPEYPHFFVYQISVVDNEDRKGIHNLTYSFDIRYRNVADISTDSKLEQNLDDMGILLMENFNIIPIGDEYIRCEEKAIEKVDGVLHLNFIINIMVEKIKEVEEEKFKNLFINIKTKNNTEDSGDEPEPNKIIGKLVVSKNGEYNARDDGFFGYNPVIVELPPPKLGELNITENGTFKAEDYDLDGWDKLMVKVESGGGEFIGMLEDSASSIVIPDGTTKLRNYCFYICKELTNITIPDSLTSIGNNCFAQCSNLTNITIPDSVTSLGNGVFSQCDGLKKIVIKSQVSIPSSFLFITPKPDVIITANKVVTLSKSNAITTGSNIYVPDDLVDDYKIATNWTTHADYIKPLSTYEGEY